MKSIRKYVRQLLIDRLDLLFQDLDFKFLRILSLKAVDN